MQFLSNPLSAPVEQLTLMQRSLLFAELASLAYSEEASAAPLVRQINLTETLFVERDGAQAYVFGNEHDCIVACRGTEPTEMNDLRADVDATSVLAETVGRVHRGFKKEVDDLWPELEEQLVSNRRTLWFSGHSLGGAMATICAGRCHLSHIKSTPKELFTFGSPRVGNRRYVHHVALTPYRWVNNNDIVTRVPPVWMGYRHTGRVMYIDSDRNHRQLNKVQQTKDRWRGFWKGLARGKIDHLADHPISGYIEGILSALPSSERGD